MVFKDYHKIESLSELKPYESYWWRSDPGALQIIRDVGDGRFSPSTPYEDDTDPQGEWAGPIPRPAEMMRLGHKIRGHEHFIDGLEHLLKAKCHLLYRPRIKSE